MSDGQKQTAGEVPSAIGRYQITGTLGSGAMGAVYKAFDPLIKRTLAIKTIRLDIPRTSPQYQVFIDRFYHEVRISGTLSHPGIVTLFDVGEENRLPFLAMEYVEGKTIGAILDEGTRFKPERVVGLVSQVAAALDYAHSRGVVHRDIKPTNLIVSSADEVKVTDFGIAKLADVEITHSGALLGTPSYMSPEQAMGEKLDGRSDIFSLGVVAFQMLSGQQPFPGANVTSILYKLVHVDPVEPADLEMSGLVPQKWREVFHKVLAKKPENRYQTATAFVQDLEYCLGSWFAGLGTEHTVTLQAPARDETTVTIPKIPVPAKEAPASRSLAGLARHEREHTAPVLLPAVGLAGEPPVPLTVLISPADANLTLPPQPTLREAATTLAPVPPRPRSSLPVGWVLGAAAMAVLALGLVGWAVWPRAGVGAAAEETAAASPAATPAGADSSESAPPAPPLATLLVESEPSGAHVSVNGEMEGQTPLRLSDLPFGSYDVRVERKGYEMQAREVSLSAAAAAGELRFVLARTAPPPQGEADVVSAPSGAQVSVDGRPVGTTPLTGLRLRPGKRRLELELEGHQPWTGTVDVAAGGTGRVEVRLEALPRPADPPTPEPVDLARVYENTAADVDTLAKKLSGSSPSYPSGRAGRLKSGERVSVLVRFVVTEAGEVQDVSVLESGGRALDDVVVAAIRGWKFQPATKRGTRVKVHVTFKQTFLGG
ncbi:MAG TPA: TonB family protein [Vicinamibacteria bacterium]|nr:TonB family protein [Vicinamibacteria bacterium]